MPFFNNQNKDSHLAAVEFSPVADGNLTFFYSDSPESSAALKAQLTAKEFGQEVVAETKVNGQSVLVTHGEKTQEQVLKALESQGEKLAVKKQEKKLNLWKLRGWASIIGQPLQLASSISAKGGLDGATATFAISNMAANITNVFFGAEKSKDENRLRIIKGEMNKDLDEYVLDNRTYDVDDKRSTIRKEPEKPKSLGAKATDFMRNNSVRVGEIGLRYFGAFALAFPLTKKTGKIGEYGKQLVSTEGKKLFHLNLKGETVPTLATREIVNMSHWKKGLTELTEGKFKKAYTTLKNGDGATHLAGLAYLGGKSIALASTVPDPYSDKPHTTMDTVREKVTFAASSAIEAVAAGVIAYDRLGDKREKFHNLIGKKVVENGKHVPRRIINLPKWKLLPEKIRGAQTRDFLGGIGGLLFMGGLAIRVFAPFGIKETNMEEVYAHATDTLAKTSPEQLPQLMADTAASLKEHFKEKEDNFEFGQIFTQMMSDMYRYHHIALDNLGTEPDERVAKLQNTPGAVLATEAAANVPAKDPEQAESAPVSKASQAILSASARRPSERVMAPAASRTEALASNAGAALPGH